MNELRNRIAALNARRTRKAMTLIGTTVTIVNGTMRDVVTLVAHDRGNRFIVRNEYDVPRMVVSSSIAEAR